MAGRESGAIPVSVWQVAGGALHVVCDMDLDEILYTNFAARTRIFVVRDVPLLRGAPLLRYGMVPKTKRSGGAPWFGGPVARP